MTRDQICKWAISICEFQSEREEASDLLKVSKPIFGLLRRVDRGGLMMGKIYCRVFCEIIGIVRAS